MLAPYVSEFNRELLIKEMFSKIYPRSVIVYVCDMSNFEGSQVPELLEEVQKK